MLVMNQRGKYNKRAGRRVCYLFIFVSSILLREINESQRNVNLKFIGFEEGEERVATISKKS